MTTKLKGTIGLVLAAIAMAGGYVLWQRGLESERKTEAGFARGVSEIPYASTRGDVDEGELTPGHTAYEYRLNGAIPGLARGVPPSDDILIVVHGLNNTPTKALNRFGLARESLQHNGYRGVVLGFSWDGSTNWDPYGATGYRKAMHNAIANGTKLAQFVVDLQAANPHASIRLLGYSMGARLIAEAIYALDHDPRFSPSKVKIATVHLVGAAINDEALETDQRYGRSIERRCVKFFNYFSPVDSKLGLFFPAVEGHRAVGRRDLEHPDRAPRNYRSRNVSAELKDVDANGDVDPKAALGRNHSAYLGIRNNAGVWRDDGAMNVVARDIADSR